MTQLSFTLPTLNTANATEDPLIRTALSDIKTAHNADHTTGGHSLAWLAGGSSAQIIVCNGSGVPTYVTSSGDVTTDNTGALSIGTGKVTSTHVLDGTLLNADVNASAAIAGSKLDTGDGRLVQATDIATASGDITLTTSYADVTGATKTFTPDVACYAIVTAVFDFDVGSIGDGETAFGQGTLVVDGTPQTPVATHGGSNNLGGDLATRSTTSQVYRVALSVASHTLKLQAKKVESGSTVVTCEADNTRFLYQLVAQ